MLAPLDVLVVINFLNRRAEPLLMNVGLQNDSGESSQDFITNNPKIIGTFSDAMLTTGTVKARLNRNQVVDVTIDSNGTFLFDPSIASTVGDGQVIAKYLVESGWQKKLGQFSFTLDTVPPNLSDTSLLPEDDSGMRADDSEPSFET